MLESNKKIMTNHQRIGIRSNAEAGSNFEKASKIYLEKILNRTLEKNVSVDIGISKTKKSHRFDLGDKETIIECKTHRWTTGDNIPSAKLTVWNEAMFYFSLAPNSLRKIFIVDKDFSIRRKKTLGQYYVETYGHLIPDDVEIWEFDETIETHKKIK
jgi:hypothetical protein